LTICPLGGKTSAFGWRSQMRFETRSLTDGKVLFESVSDSMETGISNASSHARLHSIDPDSIETTLSTNKKPESKELWRYGVEWFVNSEDYSDRVRCTR
jgi:hypothetical protein